MKTKEQQEAEILKTYKRLAMLEETKQEIISKKYYNGKRPWMENSYKEKSVFIDMEVKEHV